MSDVTKMSRDELEHEAIQAQIKGISLQISANFDEIGWKINEILAEAKKTNGRIKALEELTDIIKILKKYKWLLLLSIISILKFLL